MICYSMLVSEASQWNKSREGRDEKETTPQSEKARKKDATKLLQKKTSFAEEDTKKKTRKLQKNT